MLDKYQIWRKTKKGSAISAVIAAVLMVAFASLAVNSGSLWHWGLAFFFLFDAVLCLANTFSTQKQKTHAKPTRRKKAA